MKTKSIFAMSALALLVLGGCQTPQQKAETQLKEFITAFEAEVKPMNIEAAIASWDASITGNDADYTKSEEIRLKLTEVFSDSVRFAQLKQLKDEGNVKDSLLARELDVLYSGFLRNQVPAALLETVIKMETNLEKKYSNFRAEVNGKSLTDNDIEGILGDSKNSKELEMAWNAHKRIGQVVAADVVELVKQRNAIAQSLGFDNYQVMSLSLSEQNPDEIEALFDELDNLTRDAFAALKGEIDAYLAKRYGISKEKLMPWHYQNRYFQEAPKIYSVDLDKYYADKDIAALTATFFNGIGIGVDDLVASSDLYEKPGKNQHAYCTDIDRSGDVRVLCNLKPTYGWMNTNLHEFGHAVYAKYNNPELPYFLRDAAHSFTTEAIAMIFGRCAGSPQWMLDMGIITAQEREAITADAYNAFKLEQLTFSRWAQVMYRFEKAMYANPDQDLNALWWSLVEKYQMLKKPEGRNEPDWATKIHVALYPCYYHNYLMGELLASQLHYYIAQNVLGAANVDAISFVGKPEVGTYLKEKVFMPGMRYHWSEMIERATGEKLTAKYYSMQFVK